MTTTPPENATTTAAPESSTASSQSRRVPLKNLYLDPNNYRFIDAEEYRKISEEDLLDDDVQRRTMALILGKNYENVRDLLDSFRKNGWLPVDQIQVRQMVRGRYLVVEGNRRVAALKHLQRRYQEQAIDLGQLSPSIFDEVPVVLYPEADEAHHLVLMGLKHISGNKKWPAINQARLLRSLLEEHAMSPDDVGKRVGVTKRELNLALRTLALCESYRDSDYGDQFRSDQYSLFREILKSPSIRDWLGWKEDTMRAEASSNLQRLFSWLSREEEPLGDEDSELDGESLIRDPAIATVGQVRELSKVIDDPRALDTLDRTRNLTEATLSSEVLSNNRVKNAIQIIDSEANVLFSLTKYLKDDDLDAVDRIMRKLQGLSTATGRTPMLLGQPMEHAPFNQIRHGHFSSITIDKYRRLAGVKLEKLQRVNLLAGINNAGKTSILEAIYLLTQQNEVSALLDLMRRRAKLHDLDPRWVCKNVPESIAVRGAFDSIPSNQAALKIHWEAESELSDEQTFYLGSIVVESSYSGQSQTSRTDLFENQDRRTQRKGVHVLCPAILSSPFSMHDPDTLVRLNERSVEARAKEKILEFLREAIDSGLLSIELVNEFKRFLVTHQDIERSLDLASFGEGMQRVFQIAMLFSYAENGVVLIDEFENAIHVGLLLSFTRFVQELAVAYNTQVFLTTHSKECVDAFIRNEFRTEDISTYGLAERDGRITCVQLSGPELEELLRIGDVDIRLAR